MNMNNIAADKILFGGIEAGGTKFVCAVASDPPAIINEVRFPTTRPAETLKQVCDFFMPYVKANQIKSIGLGSFGPVDVDANSPTHGFITSTPKPNWQDTNILGIISRQLNVPVVFDMDVNAAALGEFKWGASQGVDSSLYLTIGTGIGGSYIKDGKPLKGLLALEMGHIRIPHNLKLDPFRGACPYHGDCFEGLASGPAIQIRTGQRAETLPGHDLFWEIEAGYIADALANYIFTLSPRIIILGGGVMQNTSLFAKIRQKVQKILNGYLHNELILNHIERYIVPPVLQNRAGVLGAIALALET
jgi:fructokinase